MSRIHPPRHATRGSRRGGKEMKSLLLVIVAVLFVVAGLLALLTCGGEACNRLRFLQINSDYSDSQQQYLDLLNDPKFTKVDAFGVSGFIDGREECSNYKRAAQSLSLLRNNSTINQTWESKIEAILIYREARRHGCNID
jgi:hypothetical protein